LGQGLPTPSIGTRCAVRKWGKSPAITRIFIKDRWKKEEKKPQEGKKRDKGRWYASKVKKNNQRRKGIYQGVRSVGKKEK